jgi:TPR repeat protein
LATPSAIARTGQLNAGEISALVERGRQFIASGDLAAARVALGRAAELKNAEAALVLGSTYDPVVLRRLKAFGFAPDPEMARDWYERAKEFGSEEAQRRIEIMDRSGF